MTTDIKQPDFASIEELRQKQAQIQQEFETKYQHERAVALSKIQEWVTYFEIRSDEVVFPAGPVKSGRGRPKADSSAAGSGEGSGTVAIKYRDEHGNTWSGRGLMPKWLREQIEKGAKKEDFIVSG